MQTEFGTIISVRKQFGFIKPCSRQLDIFFHFSSIMPGLELEEVKPGLEVQFLVTQEAGKACAKQVDRAPQGAVVYETITQQQVLGRIISEPTPLHGVCLQGKHTVEGAGVIRFLTDESKPVHITFKSSDLTPGHTAQPADGEGRTPDAQNTLHGEPFVFFDIITDTRGGSKRQTLQAQGGARAGQRAVNVQLLTPQAVKYLPMEQQRQKLTLELLQAVMQDDDG